ncbi:MAG: ABC transporter substrate-binding protein [Gordonia sp. (in: high G+C Gram-positive bacteria)]
MTSDTVHRRGQTLRCRRLRGLVASAVLVLTIAACGNDGSATGTRAVDNCGGTVSFTDVPSRVVLLKSASVPALAHLGVLDHVVARAGQYPDAYYDDATRAALAKIPSITDRLDAGGHLQISREEVIAQNPDLVIGQATNVTRETLAASNIPLVEEQALCGSLDGDASFDDVYDEVRMYGTIFDRSDQADEYVAQLKAQVAKISARRQGTERSVAVLYPTIGGGVTYAYGRGSMAAPLVAAAGLSDVFGDQAKRVFEVTPEELVGRNPDVIISLYSEGDPADVVKAVTSLPGAASITAVRTNTILPLLLNFAEPPTPLAVNGLQRVDEFLAAHPR